MGMFGWIGVGSSSYLRGQAFLRVMPGGTRAERGDWAWGDLGEELPGRGKGRCQGRNEPAGATAQSPMTGR